MMRTRTVFPGPVRSALAPRPAPWSAPRFPAPAAQPTRGVRTLRPAFQRPRRTSPSTVLFVLFGLNAAVFGVWWYARDSATRYGDLRLYRFMMRNFTSGEPNLREGRWWTLLTACFSHQELPHFAFNMLTFAFTAPALLPIVGAPQLLTLYVGAGLAASLTGIVWPYIVDPILHGEHKSLGRRRYGLSLGASGSVYALLSAFASLRPHATFLVFYVVPVPARMCVAGILAWELYAASFPSKGNHIDSVGHVGGLLAGLLFARGWMRG
ncbi:rhomboid protease [Malassezia obtusa]|uniref:Rhomboid protease n=1 Tax=Malassezia obtusa TaxID=76774 RepID=A0AAF0ITE7_9BASI|nr:rhomboid protease [Malassezia obtusa]